MSKEIDSLEKMESSDSIERRVENLAVELLNCGVDVVVGIPGTGPVLNFVSKFQEHGGRFLLCKNEASAPIIAGTIGRRENKPIVVVCANGTARTNLLSGILHCWFEKLPVIALWDSYSREIPEFQCLQRLPVHDFSPFFNVLLDGLGSNASEISRFLLMAVSEPNYGPVGVHLRVSNEPILYKQKVNTYKKSNDSLGDFVSGRQFTKPVLIFGAGAARSGIGEEIRKQFSDLQIPILTTIGSKGLISENNEFNLRVFTGVGGVHTPENMVLNKTDIIIGVNLRHSDVIKVKAFDKPALLFDFSRLDESYGFCGKQCFIDSVSGLKENILENVETSWTLKDCRDIMAEAEKYILTENNEAGRLIHEASKKLDGIATVVVDDGIYQKHSEYFWITDYYKQYISTGVGRNMGSALPAALGLALRYPEENVICLSGDGGLPLFLGELGMLCDQKHGKLLIIHFADFALGSMKTKKLNNIDKLVETPVSYCEVFKVFGFKSHNAKSVSEALKIVDEWKTNNYDVFLEFQLKKDKYPETFFLLR